jgi:hypothetical protein
VYERDRFLALSRLKACTLGSRGNVVRVTPLVRDYIFLHIYIVCDISSSKVLELLLIIIISSDHRLSAKLVPTFGDRKVLVLLLIILISSDHRLSENLVPTFGDRKVLVLLLLIIILSAHRLSAKLVPTFGYRKVLVLLLIIIISSDRRLSAKLVPTFGDRVCRVVSETDPNGRIVAFLDRIPYYFFQVAPQLYSRG